MAKKDTAADTKPLLSEAIKDSAQQIWLAGLGAFSKAQAEGSKAFETLVKEGVSMQRKTQSAAEERIAETTTRMSNVAADLSSKAVGQWDKLENLFEDRVAKALNKLGVPSARDIEALTERVEALTLQVQRLGDKGAATTRTATARKTRPVKKTIQPAARKSPRTRTD